MRRTPEQVKRDRAGLLRLFGTTWVRPPWRDDSYLATDLAALVKAGLLERKVKTEYDRQRGYAANLFGGAGVMTRKRAYYRAVTTVTVEPVVSTDTLTP